jgi:PPP family 3-phenylpropionic acid transporter
VTTRTIGIFDPLERVERLTRLERQETSATTGTIGTVGTIGTAIADGAQRCYHLSVWHSIPLTLFWFIYFGSLGIFYPYFSLYLRENAGLSGSELGVVLALSPLVGMAAQPLWGQVADRTGARSALLAILTFTTGLGYLAMGAAQEFRAIFFATALMALAGTAIFPLMTSASLAILRDAGPHAFGYVRAWGTAGFLLSVIFFPWLLQARQGYTATLENPTVSEPELGFMFPVIAGLVFGAALVGALLPKTGAVSLRARRGDWRELLDNRLFLRFLLFSLFAHFLMHGPMWLFPVFVRSRGGDLDTIRTMWILMLVCEIPLVLLTGSGLKKFGARGLLATGVFVGGLRWTLCAVLTDPAALFAVQVLHGVTVVGLNLGSPLYLDSVAPEQLRSTAQGFLSMVGMGIAGTVSNTAAGWLLDHGGTDVLYLICGVGSLILGLLTRWLLPVARKRDEEIAEARVASEVSP